MTVEELIRPGDKVDISYVQQAERRESGRELPKIYKSQVLDLKENGNLEMAIWKWQCRVKAANWYYFR